MPVYKEKEFRSISSDDLGLESEEEKEETKKQQEENKDLFSAIKEALGNRITEVRLSGRLKTRPAASPPKARYPWRWNGCWEPCPASRKSRQERVLELNPDHEIFPTLQKLYPDDKETLADYAELLYGQALIREGMLPEDPAAFAAVLCRLMERKEK